jgi:hypothetical protein
MVFGLGAVIWFDLAHHREEMHRGTPKAATEFFLMD